MGWTAADRAGGKKADVSPHLCLDNIDPIWSVRSAWMVNAADHHRFKAIGGDLNMLEWQRYKANTKSQNCQGETCT